MSYEDILQQPGGARASAGQSSTGNQLAVRVDDSNPNHHLWNNRGTWWCHFTLHKADYTAERVRVSLKTHNLEVARKRRDKVLASI